MKIGFIGTGLMGVPMIKNLLKSKNKISIFNRTIKKAQKLSKYGAIVSLSIDQLVKGTITGERYGRQIFTSLTYQNENEYTNYDLIPFGKFEIGITQLSEYTDFGTSATNSVDVHERLTFKTGNASGGF